MYRDPKAFRDRFNRWKEGKPVYQAGRPLPTYDEGKPATITRVYQPYYDTDGTLIRNVSAELPEITITNDILHKDWSAHVPKNAVLQPDYRSLHLQNIAQKEAQYAALQLQKLKEDAIREEGFENLMKLTSPATYAESITGKDFGPVGRLAFDVAAFGLPGAIKRAGQIGISSNALRITKLNPTIQIPKTTAGLFDMYSEEIPSLVKQLSYKPYEIETYPGYQLKSLMRGNPLEKQLSKTGTISVNSIKAQAAKGSNVEKAVIDKVLASEQFAGQKAVDYNDFRKAVHDDLITYKRVSDGRYDDYGIDRLGISTNPIFEDDPAYVDTYNNIISRLHDFELQHTIPRRTRNTTPEQMAAIERWRNSVEGRQYDDIRRELDSFIRLHPGFSTVDGVLGNFRRKLVGHSGDGAELNTYTFVSDKIPIGSSKHYDSNTLGHSRTYTTRKEPDVLHVMESLSDWGLSGREKQLLDVSEYNRRMTLLQEEADDFAKEYQLLRKEIRESGSDSLKFLDLFNRQKLQRALLDDRYNEISKLKDRGYSTTQSRYLSDNYTQRQILENLKFAAERGLTKMRYPTSETAAKIEGYQKEAWAIDEAGNEINPHDFFNFKRSAENPNAPLETLYDFPEGRGGFGYRPEHQTILKKYADFPKMYGKLYKGAKVRTVTDVKGNTWYEVDVPKDYLKQEWMYGLLPFGLGLTGYGLYNK